jgi:chromosome segregation protein
LSAATEDLARARAERRRIDTEQAELEQRVARLEAQAKDVAEELTRLEEPSGSDTSLPTLNEDLARLKVLVEGLETELAAAEVGEEKAHASDADSLASAVRTKLQAQELQTELATLLKLLKPADQKGWSPIVEAVRIGSGYEQALGASLGDDLDAASEESAPAHWRVTASEGADPDLPEGVVPLSQFVSGAPALKRRLAQIGVVEQRSGKALQGRLKPGQRLVSKEGDLWRWDGYTVAAGSVTAAGVRLIERSRLKTLQTEAYAAEGRLASAEAAVAAASSETQAAAEATKTLRQKIRQTRDELGQTRDAIAAVEHESLVQSKQLGALAEAKSRTVLALDEARGALARTQSARFELAALDALDDAFERARGEAAKSRSAHARAEAALEGFEREARLRQERIEAIGAEQELWQKRIATAREQIETLRAREGETRSDLAALANLPAEIEQRRGRLIEAIAAAERERSKAADDLAIAETELKGREKALREVQERLSAAREARARSEALLEAARDRRSETAHVIREQLDCAPEACLALAGVQPGNPLPALSEVEGRLAKLRGDRERLGGVNLRAEEEEVELATRLEEMERERADVEQAIGRLRQGIANLNREGRKRLLEAFGTVNGHFQRLFQTLFGGGTAELQLVDSDDPLESGLEILACPPGKRAQVLTLLSGGEKALTALALIFAVFLTNPSPICVLDEVDAPLDDANVERFCNLMEEMARSTDTRFLIITHHPLTMARMSRLFGVTMSERGVSQLVSVDLETAARLRDAS